MEHLSGRRRRTRRRRAALRAGSPGGHRALCGAAGAVALALVGVSLLGCPPPRSAAPVARVESAPTSSAAEVPRGAVEPRRTQPPSAGVSRPAPLPMPPQIRAVWVARMHYEFPDDIRTIMRNCRRLGFNTVLWQVRGNATVAYPSELEPWSQEFDYRDPGYDPLALAVEEAHAQGLRIEAWVNVLPGWRGPQQPPIENQLYRTHPDWFIRDARGHRQPLTDFYSILNPCLPEVRKHISAVIEEIASRYPIDGVHMDYVRYAWDKTPNAKKLYPRDARTLEIYESHTGHTPDEDVPRWDRWRAAQLTQLVHEIRQALRRARPGATLTAAVHGDARSAMGSYLQNGADWLRRGLIDAAYPMAYSTDPGVVEKDVASYRQAAPRRRVVPGLGIYKHDAAQMRRQLALCERWGGSYCVFSYAALHATAEDRRSGVDDAGRRLRRERRDVFAAGDAAE